MNRPHALREAAIFFALTLGTSYFIFWGPLAVFGIRAISFVTDEFGPWWAIVLHICGGFVPSLVGIFLTWKWEGKAGLRSLGRRVLQFKIGWKWYFVILGSVVTLTAGRVILQNLLGHPFPLSAFITGLWQFLPLLLLGPLSEELGWRGYALDRLQTRWNPLLSGMILGGLWSLWHLPIFFIPGDLHFEMGLPFLPFLLSYASFSIVYACLHNHTRGSIWTAILIHWLQTYADTVIASSAVITPLYSWLEALPYLFVTILVVVFLRPRQPVALQLEPKGV